MIYQQTTHKRRMFLFVVVILLAIVGALVLVAGKRAAPTASTPAPAPQEISMIPGYVSITDPTSELAFQYPSNLGIKYTGAQTWPPTLTMSNKPFSCVESNPVVEHGGQVRAETINGHQYCVTRATEGAAGSIYTTYSYAFPFGNTTATFEFVLKAVQCANYDDPQKSECEAERASFDIGKIVDTMRSTIR